MGQVRPVRLRYTLTVLRQIEQVLNYVGAWSPRGGVSIRDRLVTAIALVQEHPYAEQATSRRITRRVLLTPYPSILFYRITEDEIIVTRLRHAARQPLPASGPS